MKTTKPLDPFNPVSTPPLQIVLLEDQELIRDFLRLILEEEDHTITEYENGGVLYHDITSQNFHHTDLFILDICVPGISGLKIAKELRKLYPEGKIILYSALTDSDLIKNEIQLDYKTAFLRKPFKKEELMQCIANVTQ